MHLETILILSTVILTLLQYYFHTRLRSGGRGTDALLSLLFIIALVYSTYLERFYLFNASWKDFHAQDYYLLSIILLLRNVFLTFLSLFSSSLSL